MRRGEIRRHVLVLTRDALIDALNFDDISLARRDRLGSLIARLGESRWQETERALLVACGFAEPTNE